MAGDTGILLEQLLRRFEALRSGGAIKLLAIEQALGATPARELPPGCLPFAHAAHASSNLYGTPAGTGQRVYLWRWLGDRGQVEELLTGIEAAGRLLAVPLAKVGLIHPADYVPPQDLASRSAWLVATLAAAEQGLLQADGMAGGWRHWVPGGGIACDSATVKLYRSPAGQELAAADPLRLVATAVDTATRFAVFPNAVESSIALLRCLAAATKQERRECKDNKPKKPFHNLEECIKHILSTNGERERLLGCHTATQACEHIQKEYPGQPVTPPGLSGAWKKGRREGKKIFPAWPWKKQKKADYRTVVEASRVSEDFDFDRFEARGYTPSRPKPAPQPLRCAACNEDILPGEHMQEAGTVYCLDCGGEKLHGIMPLQ